MDISAAVLAAGLWSETIWPFLAGWVWPILEFLLGLGLVVVAHEFGHFIVAKAVGIKVERFAVGFGPRLVGIQGRETDYCINLFPFGGYVKMLGQEDLRPLEEVTGADRDPRSYRFKSVSARFAVISAGVVMNAILAIVLFVIIAMVGRNYPSPVLGGVRKHSPAAEARITWHQGPTTAPGGAAASQPAVSVGLEPGDRITRIEGDSAILSILGNEVRRFDRLALLSLMADHDDTFTVTVERDVDGNTWVGTADLGVRMGPSEIGGTRLSFGIMPADATVVKRTESFEFTTTEAVDPFQEDDRVLAVGGKPIRHTWDVGTALESMAGLTAPVTVQRDGRQVELTAPRVVQLNPDTWYFTDGTKLDAEDYLAKKEGEASIAFTSLVDGRKITRKREQVIFGSAEEILDLLGMVPRLRVTGIERGSAAEEAGLQPGDIVVHYGDTPLPTIRQLLKISEKVAKEGKGTQIVVERNGRRMEALKIQPRWNRRKKAALLGLCRHVDLASTVVAGVRPGSAAAAAGIEPGYVIDKVNDRPVSNWLEVFDALRASQGQEVSLTYRPAARADAQPVSVAIGRLTKDAFDPGDYEFTIFPWQEIGFFERLQVTIRKEGLGEALAWSVRETGGFMLTTYASLRALFLGTVSKEDFIGPVGIGAIAVQAARLDIMHLVYVMAFISAILAVMNFLPFPVLDGGHAVLLIIEKIRGKPAPVKLLNIVQFIGLAMIGVLILALTWQDIMRILR